MMELRNLKKRKLPSDRLKIREARTNNQIGVLNIEAVVIEDEKSIVGRP